MTLTKRASNASRKRTYRNKYGIKPGHVAALTQRYKQFCPICKRYAGDEFVVDHCHETGKVRGVICGKCNSGIGFFRDNPAAMRCAADYLEKNADPQYKFLDEMFGKGFTARANRRRKTDGIVKKPYLPKFDDLETTA